MDRANTVVGVHVPLPDLSARCIGDDVSWKGSKVTRFACIQCGSNGRDRFQWGLWQGQGLSALGTDVGILSETALSIEAQHSLACRGLSAAGFHAVSHGHDSATHSHSGRGVVLAVRSGYAGQWSEVARDQHGRALAGTLVSSHGLCVRVVGLYCPVGACLPSFSANAALLAEESATKHFIDTHIQHAQARNQLLLVGGDLNSFCSRDLDCWEGSYTFRPECVAAHLLAHGLVDCFRARHPTLRAFTFFSSSGAASRLDALWWLPSPDSLTSVLNSSVLWHWDRRVDHEPVVVDLDISLPEVPETPAAPPPWRQLVRRLQTDLPSFLAASSSAKTATFRHVEAVLRSIQAEWDQLPSPPCEGMDGLLGQPSILVPQSLSARLSSAFDVLATSLLECLPPALPVGNHQAGRASAAWHACLLELRRLRRCLLDSLTPSTTHIRVSSFPLTDVSALWSKASDMERHLHSSGVHTPALPRWDSFSDSPLEWAGHLGFPAEVAADVLTVPGASSSVVPPIVPVSWDSLPSSLAPSACLALVQTWIREAERRQAATTNRQCSTARARRLELLRLGERHTEL